MRYFILLPFLLVFIVSCGSNENQVEEEVSLDTTVIVDENEEENDIVNSFIIEPYKCGIFTIGEIVPDLPNELKSRAGNKIVNEEGEEISYDLCVIFNSLEDIVDLQLENNPSQAYEDKAITEMHVHSNYYETAKGIKVGSKIHDVAVAYPDNRIWYSYISDRYVMDTPELEHIQFILSADDYLQTVKGNSDMEILDQADFSGDAKIIGIRIY